MACENAPIAAATAERIKRVLSISGLHDLRPLLKTAMNNIFSMDEAEAVAESAALQRPRIDIAVHCCVGGDELMEFRRQNALLANIWYGLGIETSAWEIDGTHHCNVIDTLCDPKTAPLNSSALSNAESVFRNALWEGRAVPVPTGQIRPARLSSHRSCG